MYIYNKEVINSLELKARLEELSDLEQMEDYEYDEHAMLTEIIDNGSYSNSNWNSGVDLIKQEDFTDYIKAKYIELGLISDEILNLVWIDWELTAEKAANSYTEINVNGSTYMLEVN